jgi:hypothetical protein
MRQIIFAIIIQIGSISAQQVYSQTNDEDWERNISKDNNGKSNTLYSLFCYDSAGNQFQVMKEFDHVPNRQDSIEFAGTIQSEIHKMMEKYYEEYRREHPVINPVPAKKSPKRKKKN